MYQYYLNGFFGNSRKSFHGLNVVGYYWGLLVQCKEARAIFYY
jgi:hypothetical protein